MKPVKRIKYHGLVIDAGDWVDVPTLNGLGEEGWRLVATINFAESTCSWQEGTWRDYVDRKVQLIFMREEALKYRVLHERAGELGRPLDHVVQLLQRGAPWRRWVAITTTHARETAPGVAGLSR